MNLQWHFGRCKNADSITLKPKSIFAIESNFGLDDNTDRTLEEREECISAIRIRRNNVQNGGFSGYNNKQDNKQQSKPKKDNKKRWYLLYNQMLVLQ